MKRKSLPPTPEAFVRAIEALLQEHDWNLARLAERSGLSISYLSRLLNERRSLPSARTVQKLAAALQADETELMAAAGYHTPPQPAELRLVRRLQDNPTLTLMLNAASGLAESDLQELVALIEAKKRIHGRRRP